ncbi:MAG: hypothetical protein Q8P82_01150 [bacterium]|nr:hypothetical protein [bacterium]
MTSSRAKLLAYVRTQAEAWRRLESLWLAIVSRFESISTPNVGTSDDSIVLSWNLRTIHFAIHVSTDAGDEKIYWFARQKDTGIKEDGTALSAEAWAWLERIAAITESQ